MVMATMLSGASQHTYVVCLRAAAELLEGEESRAGFEQVFGCVFDQHQNVVLCAVGKLLWAFFGGWYYHWLVTKLAGSCSHVCCTLQDLYSLQTRKGLLLANTACPSVRVSCMTVAIITTDKISLEQVSLHTVTVQS
jgi:hypothetical protein